MKVPEDKIPDKISDREVKRLNYFNTQFLQEADFQDEQVYHTSLRRFHNQTLHEWGIVEGLNLARTGDKEISVSPGVAIDKLGREIVLSEKSPVKSYNLSTFTANTSLFLTIAYDNDTDEKDRNTSGETTKFTRVTERPKLEPTTARPNDDGTVIVLGQITLDGSGNVPITGGQPIVTTRRMTRSKTAPIVGTARDGEVIPAPDGNAANWVIFVSPRQLNVKKTGPSPFVADFAITVSATEATTGWTISCFSMEIADRVGSSRSAGEANYMILRK
jgi:hypothetical protein